MSKSFMGVRLRRCARNAALPCWTGWAGEQGVAWSAIAAIWVSNSASVASCVAPCCPRAILFDEPTSALNPELVCDVLTIMRDLANEA
ncbi:P-loop NTPase family protein [Paracoccus mutanolyticus]|uniref:hypothetical protein n=1 Tax=Paracoccus mutanolyticus TaxID=1499308 RepID=UPI00167BFF9A|nr:hypothetical protein [Paracoccus mutanolyticus]